MQGALSAYKTFTAHREQLEKDPSECKNYSIRLCLMGPLQFTGIHFASVNKHISCCMLFFSRILFKDKDRNWEEIENKLRSESDIPLLKTSNKVQKPVCLNNI